ncbi:MAG TPA: hypothetical protein PKD79_00740 [Candidatus Doudnabacteria bacterium]|nr:hypothetical protein [Candidatus Doudnabacteria bacterium]
MSNRRDKFQKFGFNGNHFALLAVAVVMFALLAVPHTGLNFSAMFSQSDQRQTTTTWWQMDAIDEDKFWQDYENQFALLGQDFFGGQVGGVQEVAVREFNPRGPAFMSSIPFQIR